MKKFLTLCTALLLFGSMTVVQAVDYYVAGTMNGWNTTDAANKMSLKSENTYSKTFSALGATDYQFKISTYQWGQDWGKDNMDNSQSNVTLSNGDDSNIKFTLTTTSDVTFYFNSTTQKVYVQAVAVVVPSYTFPAGTTIYYDFTSYGQGIDDKDGVWHGSTAEIFGITLSSDWQVTASTKLWRSGADGWKDYYCTTLPTEGQNMIVSTNGMDYSWDTYVPAPPTPDTYTVVGEVPGLNWDQTSSANDMTEDNGIYTLTFTNVELAVGNYNYKIVKNHSWDVSYPAGTANASFNIGTAGIYDLTFTLDLSASPEYSVVPTFKQAIIPTVKMSGTFAGGEEWTEPAEFTLASNNESASLTLENLPAGNYDFKVILGSKWLGNGHSFYRDYTGAAHIGEGDAMHLEADVAGNYTFTWTFENDSLGIDFPAEPTPEYAEIKFFAPRDETHKWDHVYAYSYKGLRKFLGEWPGTEITSTKDAGWYTVSVRKGSDLIFTDNAGLETNAIENIQENACYKSINVVGEKVEVAIEADCEVDYYVRGSKALVGSGEEDWDTGVLMSGEGNIKSITFENVPASGADSLVFKINHGTWAWSIGKDFLNLDCASIAHGGENNNVDFKTDKVQNITISYDIENGKICLDAQVVKFTASIADYDPVALYVGNSHLLVKTTTVPEDAVVLYEVTEGNDVIEIVEGAIHALKAGDATVRAYIEESEIYTAAETSIVVTVTEAPLPPDYGSYQRTITEGKYGTICLPKSGKITGATLFEIADYDGNMIYLDETATNDILGGTPYIFLATSNQLNVAYGSNVELEANHHNGLYGFYDLTGVNHVYTLAQNDGNYILYNNQYWLVSGRDAYIEEYRAYIRLDKINNVGDPAPGRRRVAMTVNGNQTATGIDALNADEAPQKLIINGQLYILRGEKMYDVTGQVVK